MKNNTENYSIPLPKVSVKFLGICISIFFIKLWLVNGGEIVGRLYSHDQTWFIKAAFHLINFDWLGPYDAMTLIRQPAYPLWIWFVKITGIPLRIATEFLLASSAFVLAAAFVKARLPQWLGLIIYIAILFHPTSFALNNETLCETLYAPILLFSLSGLITMHLLGNNPKYIRVAILTGFALAILWNTRHENFLIILLLCSYAVFEFLISIKNKNQMKQVWRRLGLSFSIIGILIISFSMAIRTMNYLTYGIFATSELVAPGFVAANRALLRIKTENPRRFVPIPADVRQKAYTVSPAFKELQPLLEGELGKIWTIAGCQANKVCDDISAGWFLWAMREAAAMKGHHRSPAEADRFYRKIADEIDAACEKNKLACRSKAVFNSLSFLNPYPSTYLPHLADSFLRLARMFNHLVPMQQERDNPYLLSRELREMYDYVANRRVALTILQPIQIKGWAFGFSDPLEKVLLRDPFGQILSSVDQFTERQDVVSFFSTRGHSAPPQTGFTLTAIPSTTQLQDFNLVFVLKGGFELIVPLLKTGKSEGPLAYSVDSISENVDRYAFQKTVQNSITDAYGILVTFLTFAAIIAAVVILWDFRKIKMFEEIFFYFVSARRDGNYPVNFVHYLGCQYDSVFKARSELSLSGSGSLYSLCPAPFIPSLLYYF